MEDCLSQCTDRDVAAVLKAIADACILCSHALRTQSADGAMQSSSSNAFGDKQLALDIQTDKIIFDRLRACSACGFASSEETPQLITMSEGGRLAVAFDPLDGSSIVGANFSVGSIFGVWPSTIVGSKGRDQTCAAYAIYGPQTFLVWARPSGSNGALVVEEFVLTEKGDWALRREKVTVQSMAKTFAPANLRAAAANKSYKKLVDCFIDRGLTLRYSGGLVPDLHHILAKGEGLFVSPASPSAPAKLRLVYECAPLALIFEAAGCRSIGNEGISSVLDQNIVSLEQRSKICIGSTVAVSETEAAMIEC